ncbi:MAG: YidD [Parcubacteria group bacterium GW2011_GWA2_43_9b]|uniref:Putative membrane protein insertion efficiency factor n=1 Tax=Candidatus Portnoybacteria bacterium RIFCSPLOWO2_02_FULL_39_11 TaxID=1802001 RepID=A0A1G2FT67_9BACT|nr:MAG: YidD [Parcubacteria group bacterium GW2011_GWA2_43_9b]OGZ41276.1 MAG: membrane protein insertion efficiency factor YidD [Candidatus Portnoybacteria bacterium RIFCSPLOWO2_02_FULL_39_11]
MFKKGAIFIINAYQRFFSPDQGILRRHKPTCRFYPTCSEYTKQAINKYGFLKGSFKGVKRISRCHPFNAGGYDPLL